MLESIVTFIKMVFVSIFATVSISTGEKLRPNFWFAPVLSMSDLFDLTTAGFIANNKAIDTSGFIANRMMLGTFGAKFSHLIKTNELVDALGKYLKGTNHTDFPVISMHFDLFDVEKAAIKAEHSDFNITETLDFSSKCYSLWRALVNREMPIVISGVKYFFLCQSASHAKIAQQRAFFVREELLEEAVAILNCGINKEAFIKDKGFIKPFFYDGLGFTGLTKVFSFKEMKYFWERTVVVDDITIMHATTAMWVDTPSNIYPKSIKTKQVVNDGNFMGSADFFAFLQAHGLRGDQFQGRGQNTIKGLCSRVDNFGSGIIIDAWGKEYNLSNVDIVIPKSVFKGWAGYSSMEDFLSNEPSFGFMQPSSNSRLTNGQVLDTLLMSRTEHTLMAEPSLNKLNTVIRCDDKFNARAMFQAFKCLAMQGVEPVYFEDLVMSDVNKATEMVREAITGWKDARVRDINTAHYSRPLSKNQYLAPDLHYVVSTYQGNPEKALHAKGEVINGKKIKLDQVCCLDLPEGKLVLARNPIVSSAEIMIVENVHCTWGVPGAVHVPADSDVAEIMSGADFDGDQILATADDMIIRKVERMPHGILIAFNKPSAVYKEAAMASFMEMQNTYFQTGAQVGARILNKDNWENHTPRWAFMRTVFASAFEQLGVDYGKYGYSMPESWLEYMAAFAKKHWLLPAYKFTKNPSKAIEMVRSMLTLQHLGEEVTEEMVNNEICIRYSMAIDKEGNLYNPNAIVEESTCKVQKFQDKQIAQILPYLMEEYQQVWKAYGEYPCAE